MFAKFPMIMLSLIFLLSGAICYLLYEEFKYNLMDLSCKPPSFFFLETDSEELEAVKLYKDTCIQYYRKESLLKSNSDIKDALDGHWNALKKTYFATEEVEASIGSREEIAKVLYNKGGAGSLTFNKAVTESLWIATIDMPNSCSPNEKIDIKKCASFISKMTDTDSELKKYEHKLINIQDSFSKGSDFLKRLKANLRENGSFAQVTCSTVSNHTSYYYLVNGNPEPQPCNGVSKKNATNYEAILKNDDDSYSPWLRRP